MYIIILITIISIIISIISYKKNKKCETEKKYNSLITFTISFGILFLITWIFCGYISKYDFVYTTIDYNIEKFTPFNFNDTNTIYINADSEYFTYYINDKIEIKDASIKNIKYHNKKTFLHYKIIKRCNSKWMILILRKKIVDEYYIPKNTLIIKK